MAVAMVWRSIVASEESVRIDPMDVHDSFIKFSIFNHPGHLGTYIALHPGFGTRRV